MSFSTQLICVYSTPKVTRNTISLYESLLFLLTVNRHDVSGISSIKLIHEIRHVLYRLSINSCNNVTRLYAGAVCRRTDFNSRHV